MSFPVKRRATYEDLLLVPDRLVAQIIDGELITSPRPAPRHARASSRLGGVLDGPFDRGAAGPGGWIILDEPELHLRSDVLVPDLAGWRRERMPRLPDADYFELAPDWVCEVLSPSTEADDRVGKMPIYAREGVQDAWLINPIGQTVEVLRLQGSSWLVVATQRGQQTVRVEPFDAIEIDIGTLWAD